MFVPLDAADLALASPERLPEASAGAEAAATRGWLVRVDRPQLFRLIHSVGRSGARLTLPVAEGSALDVVVERTRRTLSGHSLSGRVEGIAGSAATFTVNSEVVMGAVWTPGGAYEVAPLKDGVHAVRKVDQSARPPLGEPIRAAGGWEGLSTERANADGASVVDVLVVWTPKAQANAGGAAQMRAGMDLVVAWANDAYERSGAEVRLNLVGAELVDYVEDGGGSSGVDLDRLEARSDGFMDGVHGRRDALGADLVSLFTGYGNVGGVASLPGAFSLVFVHPNDSVYLRSSTFAHELGHNMGLAHDRYETRVTPPLPFGHGYVNKQAFEPGAAGDACWITIMAYPTRCADSGLDAGRVPYFSTPDRHHSDGAALGVPKSSDEGWPDGPADAVLSLNLSYPRVVDIRPGRGDDGDTPDTATPVVLGSSTVADIEDSSDVDYFRIELPEAGWLRVATKGNGVTRGVLTAEDGGLVAEDHNYSGIGYNFLIEVELRAGVYFVKVESSWDDGVDYTLVVLFDPPGVADDHGDRAAEATAVRTQSSTAGEPQTFTAAGRLQSSSDIDYFRFEVAELGVVRVGTTGETDTVGTLTPEDGAFELTDDDDGATTNFLIVAKLDPGTYFVEVRGFHGATGTYEINVSFSLPSAEPDDHADVLSQATELAIGASAGGELEVLLDRDYFRIEVPGPGPGELRLKSSTGNLWTIEGALLRPNGDLMADYAAPLFFALSAHVTPGTYFLRVTGSAASDVGTYEVQASFIADSRTVPLVMAVSHPTRQGFARIINRSGRDGVVAIHAIDDSGDRFGPVTLSLAAGRTAHFNSQDLEAGNAAKGLPDGLGAGEGDWRLELATDLDIEALAYMRTKDGFLTGMHQAATVDRSHIKNIATFNPASNHSQLSKLRLINLWQQRWAPVWISGIDDRGTRTTGVFLLLRPGESRTLTAQVLEAGGEGLSGSIGDGIGKWRLLVEAQQPIKAMSLLESPTGHLTNLTAPRRRGREASLPLFMSASNPTQQGFARIINLSGRDGVVTIHAIDDSGVRFGPVTLSLAAGQTVHFNSDDLEMGNSAKGLSGGVGAGDGNWRLDLAADFDMEALAYVRTLDGLLSSMNALVPTADGRREVVIFNPASNGNQVSRLRLVNPAAAPATITISGVDDAGAAPPEGDVTLTLLAGAATEVTAQQLEAGADHFDGRFGDGHGKWRLFIETDQDVQAMSLLESRTGHLTNLSSGTAVRVEE